MGIPKYYIIYVFQSAGLTGCRGNLIANSVQYVLSVALTSAPLDFWLYARHMPALATCNTLH